MGNSLLEDNAEYGYGMYLANQTMRKALSNKVSKALTEETLSANLRDALVDWQTNMAVSEDTRERAEQLQLALLSEMQGNVILESIYNDRELFIKRSQWMLGGDGWAYDIGFGGIDHVLASGEDVNIFVMDNEVYSNTGGQSSKATPTAAIAKFASGGKSVGKKDLGIMAMSYGNIYVAQIAMGASKRQTLKAIEEAEAYPGPSLIIAYTPCINHGISSGMKTMLTETQKAVECGYWSLYRYNPALEANGKNPMIMDFKKVNFDQFEDFLKRETRYSALYKANPEVASKLSEKTRSDAEKRFKRYAVMAGLDLEKILKKKELTETSDAPPVDDERAARKAAREARRLAREQEK